MVTGQALLVTGVAAAGGSLVATGWALWTSRSGGEGTRPRWPSRIGQVGTWITLALICAATLLLLLQLLTGDFSARYVWQHSASVEPAARRMSALLAGQEGSFLVWALFAAVAAAWTGWRWLVGGSARADAGVVHLGATAVAFAVLLLALASKPFESFADAFPALDVQTAPIEGRGLNPVLANPWMPPHTLLTFISYALIGLAFAIAACQLLRVAQGRPGEARQWQRFAHQVSRWAWLALSAALLTGVMWAYEEMTFGWFWSWDPVETATLSVWLVLTAALHGLRETGGGRRQLVVTPLLVALSFVAVVFASFVTRSGLHPSVHAFASGLTGRWLGMGLLLLVGTLAGLVVAAWRAVPSATTRQPWLWWTAWLLLGAAGLVSWGLGYPVAAGGILGRSVELDTSFFAMWGTLIAVAVLLLMGFGMQTAQGRRRDAVAMLAFFTVLTAVAAAIKPIDGLGFASEGSATTGLISGFLGRASLLALLPPAVYALLAVAERWWAGLAGASRRSRLAGTGSALVHLGAVATLVGAAFATVLASTVTVGVDPAVGTGSAEGIEVRISAFETTEHTDATGSVIEERETATVEVRSAAGRIAAGTATLSTYPERDMGRHAQVVINRGLLADSQVIFHGLGELRPDGVPVTVRRIPLIGLVWAGLLLLLVGMALMTASRGPAGPRAQAEARPRDTDRPSRELAASGTAS